ncbi:flagellar biosynthetic protein FlhB [Cribrihabitans marinus]|uniref:Flagellar biosynthetic protein FlhB n=1 Tax=Cribrihabitans marinus TaxID=1227549 RepID=A0A1H7DI16_9RHOB|nr:flagellar type III secretion system protein FlhB [Cribrihabitans marinus]GGH39455.1 flagellar biosynthesis protein FlhB [Cribrihabitans marinus]SEK01366.1 flagellar biosynthetic protein FlhB [Cribrihabitans marinus]
MSGQDDEADKSFDPTPQKLLKAREKGEVARSADLSVVAAYGGLLVAVLALGADAIQRLGDLLIVLIDQPDQLAALVFAGRSAGPVGGILGAVGLSVLPIFAVPAAAVILSVLAQNAFVVSGTKVRPKLSRLSILSNAKNKFGRGGLFEFAKSFAKLVLYSICLGAFLSANLAAIVSASAVEATAGIALMLDLLTRFMLIVLSVALAIGLVDFIWQRAEHLRKNRMSRKEIMDETKEAEGDPHLKGERRQRGQAIAKNQMMADVPTADVVIVNPTHFAVALKWSRAPGAAPVCVAKGVDSVAAAIRSAAQEAAVPVHSDPPTARALHATVEIGQEIAEEHYLAVAAAIRFADSMRRKARGRIHR